MALPEKILAVEKVFEELDREISQFQSWSTLHCGWGCGKCCFKPDIEATILEFLPFAQFLYREGKAFEWLEKIRNSDATVCHILNPTQNGAGLCSEYPHRGLICRLFGYSARTDKYGRNELVTCQIIKTDQAEAFNSTKEKITGGAAVPVMGQYYMQLHSIDPELSREFFPINEAIRKAIETVLQYYSYRETEGL
jgi:uncharacterized protein